MYTDTPKMKSLGQGFQKLERENDRQTDTQADRRNGTHYQPHSLVIKIDRSVCVCMCVPTDNS